MDEHPGDTLGNRFLTFWGALGTIVALALLLALYRWIAVPSASAVNDGGAGNARLATLSLTAEDQTAEYGKAVEVEAGKTVRLPADHLIAFAAKTLAAQKAAPGPLKTPEALVREQEEKAKNTHDPNLSKFEGK
jgi:hypothetical protein